MKIKELNECLKTIEGVKFGLEDIICNVNEIEAFDLEDSYKIDSIISLMQELERVTAESFVHFQDKPRPNIDRTIHSPLPNLELKK